MFLVIRIAVAIVFAGWLIQQVRKPNGWLGRSVVRAMSVSHAAMTDWGLKQLIVAENASVLDLGYGGGRSNCAGRCASLKDCKYEFIETQSGAAHAFAIDGGEG
jgi:hypothetical protein